MKHFTDGRGMTSKSYIDTLVERADWDKAAQKIMEDSPYTLKSTASEILLKWFVFQGPADEAHLPALEHLAQSVEKNSDHDVELLAEYLFGTALSDSSSEDGEARLVWVVDKWGQILGRPNKVNETVGHALYSGKEDGLLWLFEKVPFNGKTGLEAWRKFSWSGPVAARNALYYALEGGDSRTISMVRWLGGKAVEHFEGRDIVSRWMKNVRNNREKWRRHVQSAMERAVLMEALPIQTTEDLRRFFFPGSMPSKCPPNESVDVSVRSDGNDEGAKPSRESKRLM